MSDNISARLLKHDPFLRRLPYIQRRYYPSANHLPGSPNILPYTAIAICCAGCAFANYARTTEPRLLKIIDQHAVCSLQNIREGSYYTMITSSFMHWSPIHLACNMYGLYTLGGVIVSIFGPGAFLTLWIGSSLVCDTATLYMDWLAQQPSRGRASASVVGGRLRQIVRRPEAIMETKSVGASGSVLGLFAAFCCTIPKHKIILFPIPIPMPAWVGAGVFAAGSAYCLVNQLIPGIGHAGHLGGMAFGVAYYYTWGRRILRRAGRFF